MARKTRDQLAAEQLELAKAEWGTLRRGAWQQRLLTSVLAACNRPYVFTVREENGVVKFGTYDDPHRTGLSFYGSEVPVTLPDEMDWSILYELGRFERALVDLSIKEAADALLASKHKAALEKLTSEERDVLGLT